MLGTITYNTPDSCRVPVRSALKRDHNQQPRSVIRSLHQRFLRPDTLWSRLHLRHSLHIACRDQLFPIAMWHQSPASFALRNDVGIFTPFMALTFSPSAPMRSRSAFAAVVAKTIRLKTSRKQLFIFLSLTTLLDYVVNCLLSDIVQYLADTQLTFIGLFWLFIVRNEVHFT